MKNIFNIQQVFDHDDAIYEWDYCSPFSRVELDVVVNDGAIDADNALTEHLNVDWCQGVDGVCSDDDYDVLFECSDGRFFMVRL